MGADTFASSSSTAFRESERYWKSRSHPPNLLHAFSASSVAWSEDGSAIWTPSHATSPPPQRIRRLVVDGKVAIAFDDSPGLVLLPEFLTPALQRDLVRKALCEAAVSPPNTTSLDPHFDLPNEGIWAAAKRSKERRIRRRDPTHPVCQDCAKGHDGVDASEVLQKLRWATVGDIYDWTQKVYLYDRPTTPIPPLISRICLQAVRSIDWRAVYEGQSGEWDDWHQSYRPEAGLINFYHPKDTLTAHVDQAESDATSPLVSISIGLPAVFLIGGRLRDTPPIPLLLQSGDVVIMAGQARQAYHGVPRVLEGPMPSSMLSVGDDSWAEEGFEAYMRTTRVNLNVRQVRSG